MIRKAGTSPPQLRWLSLRKFEGTEVGQLLGLFDARTLLAELTSGRYLTVAAEGKGRIALFDLHQDSVHVFTNVTSADVTRRLFLTEDLRKLVQLTEGGQLAIYSVDEKRRIAGGRFIDDEIVFSDDRGYFGGTPEGAHYIYLKFPGVSGYHTFHQFRATLERPDIIRALLTHGKSEGSKPQLSAPRACSSAWMPKGWSPPGLRSSCP